MRHKIIIGDWSGDGHGDTVDYIFTTDDRFTGDVLAENYLKNVTKYGIDPTQFCKEYEDCLLPNHVYNTLVENGFNPKPYDSYSEWYEEYKGIRTINSIGMAQIIMFLIGNGLTEFDYEWELDKLKPLVGGYDAPTTGKKPVGYGLTGL